MPREEAAMLWAEDGTYVEKENPFLVQKKGSVLACGRWEW